MSRSKEEREDNRARFGSWNAVRPKRRPAPKLEVRPVALPPWREAPGRRGRRFCEPQNNGLSFQPKILKEKSICQTQEMRSRKVRLRLFPAPRPFERVRRRSAAASVFWFSLFTKRTVPSNLNYTNKRTVKKQKIRPSKGEGRIFVYRNVCYLQFSTRTKKRRSAPRVHSSNNKRANKNPPLPYVRNSVSSLVSRVPDPSETTLQI